MQISNTEYQTSKVRSTGTSVLSVGYFVLDIVCDDNAEHQTLNIKYPTSNVGLTSTSVFGVGYFVLDIFDIGYSTAVDRKIPFSTLR
jgi:hypothetical protein